MAKIVPDTALVVDAGRWRVLPVIRTVAHPPHQHPKNCPIRPDMYAVERVTWGGTRWDGFTVAPVIDSRLRMVVDGFDPRNELVKGWEDA